MRGRGDTGAARARGRLRGGLMLTVLAVWLSALPRSGAAAEGAGPAEVLAAMEPAYAGVESYTARFSRQEVVRGAQRPPEEALVKFQRPGRLYLRWTEGPPSGREIILDPERHGQRALVREPGLLSGLFTILLAPDSPHVLRESRHPITDMGLGRLVDMILTSMRRAEEQGGLSVRDAGPVEMDGRQLRRIEIRVPRGAGPAEDVRRALVTIDIPSGLPVETILSDGDGRPVARYAYRDLRLNPPLGALDFDPTNPAYGFPRWRLSR